MRRKLRDRDVPCSTHGDRGQRTTRNHGDFLNSLAPTVVKIFEPFLSSRKKMACHQQSKPPTRAQTGSFGAAAWWVAFILRAFPYPSQSPSIPRNPPKK